MANRPPRKLKASPVIVAVDGPSGAGKSTVSQGLARALGGTLVDTGAMYRAVALAAVERQAETVAEYERISRKLKFSVDPHTQVLLVDGVDLGSGLRSQAISHMASVVSKEPRVRKVLTQKQRTLAKALGRVGPVVVEGRDIGTVVLPEVRFKFFVTADPEVRARRRREQLQAQGLKAPTLKELVRQIEERDARDSNREVAPLKCAKDAIVVDSTSLDVKQVVTFMVDHIKGVLILEGRSLA